MNTNISKLFCLVLLTTLIVLATACATPEQPAGIAQTTTTAIPATAPKPIIQVIPYKGAVKDRVIFTEEISQNNCGNSRDLPHSVDRSQTVAYTLEVGGGVTVNVDGTISAGLPGDLADIEVSVGAEVAAQYGVSYGKEETFSKSLTVVTEAGSNRQFTIRHIELWETGELVITIGEWQQRYPYKFRRGFGLEQVDSRDLGCPTPTVEPTGTPPPEPPLTPTRRPPTTTPTPTLPPEESGWHLYDDFTAPDALDTNWWLNDENQICTLNVSEGQLSFDCSNETAGDLGAALHPSHPSDTLTGIAVTVSVERIGGPFQLVTSWKCDADGSRRDYHLELDMDAVRATEFYPQENWRIVPLGEVAVTPSEAHVLQMERTSDNIEFFVDGQPLLLNTAPELPACFSTNYWSFDFWVWKDGNRLKGQIDQVSVQSTDAPVSPSPTPTPNSGASIDLQLCSPLDYQTCQCTWGLGQIERDATDTMGDTWDLGNTGTDTLEIHDVKSSCEDCLTVKYGNSISSQSHTPFTAWYYPDRDPQRGIDHNYTMIIHSNAGNCPELEIVVPIRYKD